jgi:hypothetical protein
VSLPDRPSKAKDNTSMRFQEWWARYPRKTGEQVCAQLWISLVTTDNEAAVFACLGRYLASDEVSRKVVMAPNNWLHDCSRDGWKSDWPAAFERPKAKTPLELLKEKRDAERTA